jgi:hypothetical protein
MEMSTVRRRRATLVKGKRDRHASGPHIAVGYRSARERIRSADWDRSQRRAFGLRAERPGRRTLGCRASVWAGAARNGLRNQESRRRAWEASLEMSISAGRDGRYIEGEVRNCGVFWRLLESERKRSAGNTAAEFDGFTCELQTGTHS